MTKWLPDISPTDRAVDVAARSLASRFEAVRWYLRRSVKKPGQPENVHQLRVWCRRSAAALSLYADLVSRRSFRRMRKTLRRVRRAAGRVRDCDVFAARVVGPDGRWPNRLWNERVRAQRELVTLFDRLDGGRKFKQQSARLIDRLLKRNRRSTETFAARARESIRPIATNFFAAFPTPTGSESELHRFRIAGKDLRYAMELLAGAFPAAFRDKLYPQLVKLQEKLGQINDLVGARARFAKRMEQTSDPAKLSDLRRRLAATDDELALARMDFHRSWTPAAQTALRTQFDEMLR